MQFIHLSMSICWPPYNSRDVIPRLIHTLRAGCMVWGPTVSIVRWQVGSLNTAVRTEIRFLLSISKVL